MIEASGMDGIFSMMVASTLDLGISTKYIKTRVSRTVVVDELCSLSAGLGGGAANTGIEVEDQRAR